MILTLIIVAIIISAIVRLLTAPFRYSRCYRPWGGYGYGYNPYRYGCRRHHRLLGGLLPIIALVALDRLFTRRF